MLPYNKGIIENEFQVVQNDDVSEISLSDIPIYTWEIPSGLTSIHSQNLIKMWLDFARQNMKLKEMVSDLI